MTAEREFAASFVALANTPAVPAAVLRRALTSLSEEYQDQVAEYWEAANKEALRLLVLVMENNPKKTPQQILLRPDVSAVLRQPYLEAAAKSKALLANAWSDAETLAVKHTRAEMKTLGVDWAGHSLDAALLDALTDDLDRNAKAMRDRFRAAMADPARAKARLTGVAEDGKRRARYSTQVAVWGAASEVRDTAADAAGLGKMWVAVLDAQTCSHCKALHGTVLQAGLEFPADAGGTVLGVYRDVLIGPPRHPNCRCVLALVKLKKPKNKN